MQSIEITGKSKAEATEAAAAKLGVPAAQLTVTVLEETKGLFGKSNVRIRAEVAEAAAPAAEKPAKPAARGKAPKAAPKEEVVEEAPVAVAEEPKKRGGRGGKKSDEGAVAVAEPEVAADVENGEAEVAVVATDADGKQLVEMLRSRLAKAELNVTADVKDLNGRYVTIELDGKDAAYLVGKQGEVLNATQYLVNIMANRKFNNGVRATLDGNNYRKRRESRLETMATELAKQVKARGEEAVLDALPAFERRIVHKVLSTVDGITTYSEGEEPNRRVVIAPAD